MDDEKQEDRFDLEQAIMNSWATTDDLNLLAENILSDEMTNEEIANALIGLSQLHHLRAKRVFSVFEALVELGDIQ